MTADELKLRFPRFSEHFIAANATDCGSPSAALLELRAGNGALAAPQFKAGNSGKHVVRITSHRRRLLDEDNLCEKYAVDSLRYAGILPSDAPDCCQIQTAQIKVASKQEEKTVIEIEYPA
jgi:hypothetical protein